MTNTSPLLSAALLPALILADGCSGSTDELARIAAEAARQQAAQQEQLVDETRKLSDASRKLVESDAAARQELTEFQSNLEQQIQAERQNVDRQREKLDDERRDIESRRHRDPLIAASLPIVLLMLLLRAAREEPADAAIGELLIQELTSERPLLLPGPMVPSRDLRPPSPVDDEPPRLDATNEAPSGEAGSSQA